MSYTEIVEERGTHRVVLAVDEEYHEPDGDFFGYVIALEPGSWGARAELLGKAHGTPDRDTFNLADAWDRLRDMDLVERYLRIFWDAVGVDSFDTRETKVINVVTRDDLELWGNQELDGKPSSEVCAGNLDEWRAYFDGDVWGWCIEELQLWRNETTGDKREEWQEIDSCWGYYGYDWAERNAREALDTYEPVAAE